MTVTMSLDQRAIEALAAAVRAPSPHNTQPWLFEFGPGRIDLHLDRDRVLGVADPDGREARIACGAALCNLRLSLRSAGLAVRVDLTPDRNRPDLLARVWLAGRRRITQEEHALAAAIPARHSNRRPFLDRAVPSPERRALIRAADLEGGRLVLLDNTARYDAVVTLLRRAELLQREDPAFRAEKQHWTATDPDRLDGVPPIASGPPALDEPLVLLRGYGAGPAAARRYEQQPLLAVLASRQDAAVDHVRTGVALQRVLLVATTAGLSASFLSPVVERPESRAVLRALLDRQGHPQVVLRIGYGYPAPSTPRRRLGDVIRPTHPNGGDRR